MPKNSLYSPFGPSCYLFPLVQVSRLPFDSFPTCRSCPSITIPPTPYLILKPPFSLSNTLFDWSSFENVLRTSPRVLPSSTPFGGVFETHSRHKREDDATQIRRKSMSDRKPAARTSGHHLARELEGRQTSRDCASRTNRSQGSASKAMFLMARETHSKLLGRKAVRRPGRWPQ